MKIHWKYIYLLVFIAVAYVLLPVMNSDYLYTVQDNDVFVKGRTFMTDIVNHNGGRMAWVACYLTQFFYYPWLGSTLIIALWALLYLATVRMFRISDKYSGWALVLPSALLFNLLDYGYWIYYAKTPGFAFLPTLACFFVVGCAWMVNEALRNLGIKWLRSLTPPICLCVVFTVLCYAQSSWRLNNHQSSFFITMNDKNFRHELKMYRALDECRFEDILTEFQACKGKPTNLMVMLKNIALMHTGQLTKMFKMNNCGGLPNAGNALKVHISQLAAPLIYYQFGQINFAYRWAIENAVEYGWSFRNLKMLVRCSIINQEFDVAMKYLAILKASTFYRDWALAHEQWISSSTHLTQSREFQAIAPLLNDNRQNCLDVDNGLCEKYILDYFSDLRRPTSQKMEDAIMCLSLWTEDDYAFCVHFYDYVQRHPNQPIPELYQEGAILLCTMERSPITLTNFPFDAVVSDRYNRFAQDYNQLSQQGLDEKEMAKRLKTLYGDTYWWYYYFYTDFSIY